MNYLSFDDWKSILPKIAPSLRTDVELRQWYADELSELNKDEEAFGYKKYEALTYSGEDLFYIKLARDGEDRMNFYVVEIDPKYKITAYGWYTRAGIEETFKKLNKSVFDALREANLVQPDESIQ